MDFQFAVENEEKESQWSCNRVPFIWPDNLPHQFTCTECRLERPVSATIRRFGLLQSDGDLIAELAEIVQANRDGRSQRDTIRNAKAD